VLHRGPATAFPECWQRADNATTDFRKRLISRWQYRAMTKNLGTDYDPHEERRKPGILSWAFDLLMPLTLVLIAVAIGRYGWPLW